MSERKLYIPAIITRIDNRPYITKVSDWYSERLEPLGLGDPAFVIKNKFTAKSVAIHLLKTPDDYPKNTEQPATDTVFRLDLSLDEQGNVNGLLDPEDPFMVFYAENDGTRRTFSYLPDPSTPTHMDLYEVETRFLNIQGKNPPNILEASNPDQVSDLQKIARFCKAPLVFDWMETASMYLERTYITPQGGSLGLSARILAQSPLVSVRS